MKMKRNVSGAEDNERDRIYKQQVQVANISGGPLDYSYPMHSVSLHFGLRERSGSEHTVGGRSFPGEVHFTQYTVQGSPKECFPGCENALGKLRQKW